MTVVGQGGASQRTDGTTRSRASRDELRQLGPPIGREPFRPAVLQPVWAG